MPKSEYEELEFIDADDVRRLVSNATNVSDNYKREFMKFLGIEYNSPTRFFETLADFLDSFDIEADPGVVFTIGSTTAYQVDYYIPEYKLVVWYNDTHNDKYVKGKTEKEQRKICDKLGLECCIVSDLAPNDVNVNLVLTKLKEIRS